MVDRFAFAGAFRRFAQPRTGRSETAERAAAIDDPEVVAAKAHDMVAVVELSEADEFADRASLTKAYSPRHLISPRERTRRASWSASYHGSSTRSGVARGEGA